MNRYQFAQKYVDLFAKLGILSTLILIMVVLTYYAYPNNTTLIGIHFFGIQAIVLGILFVISCTLLPKNDEELKRLKDEGKI